MLDSRRDCRYRGGAHRNIGVGLDKVTCHNMLGTSSGVPGFPLTLIHPSAWNVNSANFRFKEFSEVRRTSKESSCFCKGVGYCPRRMERLAG
jgi:hypothetical protein